MKKAGPFLVFMVFLVSPLCFSQDIDLDGIPDENETLLAKGFAPVLRFAPTEAYFPVDVSYALENSMLKQIVGDGEAILYTEPTVLQIASFTDPGSKHFLDNVHGGIDDRGVEQDFVSKREDLMPTVYAHVLMESTYTVVQYWFYYPFNDGPLNSHEGDWEMVQVTLEDEKPLSASYSQHFAGQMADWSEVLKREGHPVVYVARGSHANYFRSYQGVLGVQSDQVSGGGPTIGPDDYELVVIGELEAQSPGDEWIKFAGRWGEWGEDEDALRGRRGPPGPAHGDNAMKWESPVGWEIELNNLNTGWLWLSWLVANFAVLFVIYLVLRGAWTLFGLGRSVWNRKVFGGVGFGSVIAIIGAMVAIFAIWQPWYYLTLNVPEGDYRTDGEVTVLKMDGVRGLQVNDPQSNRGLVSLYAIKVPIGLVMVSGFVFLVLDVIKAKNTGELRGRLIRSGVFRMLVPVVPILVIIMVLGSIISTSVSEMVEEKVPDTVEVMLGTLQTSPVLGHFSGEIEELGNVKLRWGLGLGSLLMLAGGLLQVLGGLVSEGKPGKGEDGI